ncbi:hypothetical protein K491DRAFT_723355 [Lophiostoma macrostomum CBS 122681]|uniref:Uncharacterized protein n=1 Tax=Lophiostoma macrostomum CBS 122681 TaxID=1314788 RepID=A0A6A6SKN7_9PLEO|nr:hypothetical protein K491DRAFT_723355 [Lophiostoma macrostomum CBS 122681]
MAANRIDAIIEEKFGELNTELDKVLEKMEDQTARMAGHEVGEAEFKAIYIKIQDEMAAYEDRLRTVVAECKAAVAVVVKREVYCRSYGWNETGSDAVFLDGPWS